MSMRTIARSSSKRKSASDFASSVLPVPVGPRNRNDPVGRLGSAMPARERRTASLGHLGLAAGAVEALPQVADPVERGTLLVPPFLQLAQGHLELDQVGAQLRQARLGGVVLLLFQREFFQLEPLHAPAQLVDLHR